MNITPFYLFIFLAFSTCAHADVFLETGGFSYHFGVAQESQGRKYVKVPFVGTVPLPAQDEERYNEVNHGAGIRLEYDHDFFRSVFICGEYLNSIRKTSYYFGSGVSRKLAGDDILHFDYGAIVGGISGYGPHIDVVALPFIRVGYDTLSVSAMVAPATREAPTTLMLSIAFRIY